VACNTTDGQVIVLVGSEQGDGAANAGVRNARYNILGLPGPWSLTEPLNITEAIIVFWTGVVVTTGYLSPIFQVDTPSLLFSSLGSNYSSISIAYPGEAPSILNLHLTDRTQRRCH
jgi:hypothetical protein